jgi:hypothetical protein
MRCHVNMFNCLPGNDTEDVVIKPLSSNGRPQIFQLLVGMPQYKRSLESHYVM